MAGVRNRFLLIVLLLLSRIRPTNQESVLIRAHGGTETLAGRFACRHRRQETSRAATAGERTRAESGAWRLYGAALVSNRIAIGED